MVSPLKCPPWGHNYNAVVSLWNNSIFNIQDGGPVVAFCWKLPPYGINYNSRWRPCGSLVLKIASLLHQLQFKMAALWQPCVENCLPMASNYKFVMLMEKNNSRWRPCDRPCMSVFTLLSFFWWHATAPCKLIIEAFYLENRVCIPYALLQRFY